MRIQASAPGGSTPSWFTPLGWWLRLEEGLLKEGLLSRPFDLDPCADREAPVSKEVLQRNGIVYFRELDGLTSPWPRFACVWLNPPYASEELAPWLYRMQEHVSRSGQGAALVPAWTDREWWHGAVEPQRRAGLVDVRFLPGRLRFGWPGNPTAVGGDSARFPSAVVIWRRR